MNGPTACTRSPWPSPRGPREALLVGRHQLAVHRADLARRRHVDERGVEAVPAPVGRALDAAEDDRDAVSGGRLPQRVQVAALDLDRLIHVVGVQLLLGARVEARPVGPLDPERIARAEGLAKGHERTSTGRRVLDPRDHLGERPLAVQPDRCHLRQPHHQGVLGSHRHLRDHDMPRAPAVGTVLACGPRACPASRDGNREIEEGETS